MVDDTIILFKKKHQVAKSMIHFMQVKLQLTYSNTLRLWQKDNFNCNLTTTTKRIPWFLCILSFSVLLSNQYPVESRSVMVCSLMEKAYSRGNVKAYFSVLWTLFRNTFKRNLYWKYMYVAIFLWQLLFNTTIGKFYSSYWNPIQQCVVSPTYFSIK